MGSSPIGKRKGNGRITGIMQPGMKHLVDMGSSPIHSPNIKSFEIKEDIMKSRFFVLSLGFFSLLALASCGEFVDPSKAVSAAESAGFTDVRMVQQNGITPSWDGCSSGDGVAFHMSGKNPIGKQTAFLVCCGTWVKGCTVRY